MTSATRRKSSSSCLCRKASIMRTTYPAKLAGQVRYAVRAPSALTRYTNPATLPPHHKERGMSKHSMLVVEDLHMTSKTAAGLVRAVRSVSFAVQPGEFYTLLGASGCSKTTILR